MRWFCLHDLSQHLSIAIQYARKSIKQILACKHTGISKSLSAIYEVQGQGRDLSNSNSHSNLVVVLDQENKLTW